MSDVPTDEAARARRRNVRRLLALPVAALALALWYFSSRARADAPLDLHLGAAAPSVRQVDLVFRTRPGDARALDLTLRFAAGAPTDVYKSVHLHKGTYAVTARILATTGDRTVDKRVDVDPDRPTVIDVE